MGPGTKPGKGRGRRAWAAILNRVVREGLPEKTTFMQNFEAQERAYHVNIWGEVFWAEGATSGFGPEVLDKNKDVF